MLSGFGVPRGRLAELALRPREAEAVAGRPRFSPVARLLLVLDLARLLTRALPRVAAFARPTFAPARALVLFPAARVRPAAFARPRPLALVPAVLRPRVDFARPRVLVRP